VTSAANCDLCVTDGGQTLWRNDKLRVVAVEGAEGRDYPGFCRVVWNAHVKEMSDLPDADKSLIMAAVFRVETALRAALTPEKINLASLGNMTPHVHWHVIPRYTHDATFPKPIWAARTSAVAPGEDVIDTLKAHESAGAWKRAVREALDNL
jgi:diadenosine tetraphosphate (Ap4A) HIT family hydrolase